MLNQESKERTRYFEELWSRQAGELAQQDKAAIAYMKHILGVDEQTIGIFTGDMESIESERKPKETIDEVKAIIGGELSIDNIKKIHDIYSLNMLGLKGKEIEDYAKRNLKMTKTLRAEAEIGYRQGAVKPSKNDGKSFWEEIAKIFPKDYSEDDIKWLIRNDSDGSGARSMLNKWEFTYPSNLVAKLSTNAHAYK